MKSRGKVCCIAILDSRDHIAAARAALCQNEISGLSQSLLRKPDCRDVGASFYRLPVVGVVIGEGPIAGFMESIHSCSDCEFNSLFRALFNDIGVPEIRHQIYLSALKERHVLIILQGSEHKLRKASEILDGICLEKPVLSFS